MPDYAKNIVYLSKQQYAELITNGSITVDGVTVAYNENDIYVTPQADPVTDVRINGTSIVENGIANVPFASTYTPGVMKVYHGNGLVLDTNNTLMTNPPLDSQIKSGTETHRPIVSAIQHRSTFYGLAKAAGDMTQSESSNDVGTYTDEAKAAILSMLGAAQAEKLIFKDDTFGNIWTFYQPIGIDLENNAIILEDATGIPAEMTAPSTAFMTFKWSEDIDFQYGTMPTELMDTSAYRIKSIGDNKVQFFNYNQELVAITDSGCLDFTKCRILYRTSNKQPAVPSCILPTNHKIHVRFGVSELMFDSSGVMALDSTGAYIKGTGYGHSTARRRDHIFGIRSNPSMQLVSSYDSYADIIGSRGLTYPLGVGQKKGVSIFDLWIEPDCIHGWTLYKTESVHFCVDTQKKTNWFEPRVMIGAGYSMDRICGLKVSTNSGSDWFGPGSFFEVYDCGPV